VEVRGQLGPELQAVKEPLDLHWVRHPGRIPEGNLLAPGLHQLPRDQQHALARHLPLVGAPERHRDHALAAEPLVPRPVDHPLEARQRLLNRPVHVLPVVGLRGGQEEVDLVEGIPHFQRVVEPALVRDEHRHGHVVGDVRRAQDLRAVGQLGNHVGAHEARDLEPPDAGARQHLDQAHLVGRRDDFRLVLEAVPRADLADAHLVPGHAQILARPPLTPSA
jgi:hypothetical protein